MNIRGIELTPRQKRLLVVLHDLHLKALLHRTAGKRIPSRLKKAIKSACLRAFEKDLHTIRSVPFKVKEVQHIVWPERLLKSLSCFL